MTADLQMLEQHRTLEQAVRWGLMHSPPRLVANVIKQDEYTLDVVLPIGGGGFAVYDTT